MARSTFITRYFYSSSFWKSLLLVCSTNRRESRTLVHGEVSSHFLLVWRDLRFVDVLFGFVAAGEEDRKFWTEGTRSEEVDEEDVQDRKKGKWRVRAPNETNKQTNNVLRHCEHLLLLMLVVIHLGTLGQSLISHLRRKEVTRVTPRRNVTTYV